MKFLYNAPAILYKGAVIVGDTHFGMEQRLRRKGIYDDQFSARQYERLKALIMENKAKRLILLGDVKDDITMLDARTEGILAKLSMLCEVTIVRGNHDGGIEHCGNALVVGPDGFAFGKLGLLHGHSWPAPELMLCDYLVMGHQHPLIAQTDAFGKRRTEPAWMIAPCDADALAKRYEKFNKKISLIMMPAFNPMSGSVVNIDEKERLGPILNNKLFKLNDAIVFRLDGTCLGKLETIR